MTEPDNQRPDRFGAPAPASTADPAPAQYGQSPYPEPPYYGYGYQPVAKSSGMATTSLVLGIVSLLCGGFLLGIPAMILGSMAKREIDRSGGRITGRGLATAGFWTGLVGTVLAPILVLLVFALGGVVHSSTSDTSCEPVTASGTC